MLFEAFSTKQRFPEAGCFSRKPFSLEISCFRLKLVEKAGWGAGQGAGTHTHPRTPWGLQVGATATGATPEYPIVAPKASTSRSKVCAVWRTHPLLSHPNQTFFLLMKMVRQNIFFHFGMKQTQLKTLKAAAKRDRHSMCARSPESQPYFFWPFEQPGLVEDVPARGRGLEPDDLRGPFQPKPFYDSIKQNESLKVVDTWTQSENTDTIAFI